MFCLAFETENGKWYTEFSSLSKFKIKIDSHLKRKNNSGFDRKLHSIYISKTSYKVSFDLFE
jgi:hypothetical protein